MSTHSHDDDSSSDLSPVASRAVLTPRGGFMARPGLKNPPRHAVVVRGGNADLSDEIPVARSSCPPPAPPAEPRPSDPAPLASCDKVTIPAIPRLPTIDLPERATPKFDTVLPPPPDSAPAAWAPRGVGSVPPPSDAPVATNVRESVPSPSPAKRRSAWAVVAAAAIGLLLGVVSIVTTMGGAHSAAQQPALQSLPEAPLVSPPPSPVRHVPVVSSADAPHAPPPPSAAAAPAQPATPPAAPPRKKSIF